ncbi:hypothetical protein EX30DRAFT_341032, partial [Ascodesmis nigricans]
MNLPSPFLPHTHTLPTLLHSTSSTSLPSPHSPPTPQCLATPGPSSPFPKFPSLWISSICTSVTSFPSTSPPTDQLTYRIPTTIYTSALEVSFIWHQDSRTICHRDHDTSDIGLCSKYLTGPDEGELIRGVGS